MGGKGRAVNLPLTQTRKYNLMISKQTQVAMNADSLAQGKANRQRPPGRFVTNTAGRIDSRLTWPKLHLATFIKCQILFVNWQ